MKGTNPFTYIDSLSSTKRHLMRGTDNDDLAEKGYVAFLTNRTLSLFSDTIGYANVLNRLGHLANRLQYDYLFYSIRPRKRFAGKWPKPIKDSDLAAVQERFQCGPARAAEIIRVLTASELAAVYAALEKGGKP